MDIKYTSDGKKVVIIGNLNSQEKIVQEIFIVNGQEVPSGENFVVKSLHDCPAISWKEKRLAELEATYDKRRKEIEDETSRLQREYRRRSEDLRNKLQYVGNVLKNVSPDSFKTLVDYLTGNIKYMVYTGYSPELIEFKDFVENYEDRLRLVSIYGKDDGTLTYAVGQYYDYSGGNRAFIPFTDYETAFEFFTKQMHAANMSEEIIKRAEKYKISLPADKVQAFKDSRIKGLQKSIEDYRKRMDDQISQLQELESK